MEQTNQMKAAITRELADKANAVRLETTPADVISIAKQCVLDWLGVTLAGQSEKLTASLTSVLKAQGGNPSATIVGSSLKLPSVNAALLNGTASHALDYDDVSFSIPGHASAPVLTAVLALGEEIGATGAEVLEAFIAGYEVSCRVGALVAPDHYTMGFHATGTVGSFGAAAACSKLLRLTPDELAQSIGIAATRAAGLKAAFGTSCKPLQCGNAASNGVLAALLARSGFDGPADALEHRAGFAATHSESFNDDIALGVPAVVRDLAKRPQVGSERDGYHLRFNLFKFHAACFETHAAIECALDIARQIGRGKEIIRSVRLVANRHCDDICNILSPTTALESKFSLRLAATFGLLGITTADPHSFSIENATNPNVIALRDKISVELVDDISVSAITMTAQLVDGREVQATHDLSTPASDIPEQGNRVQNKFLALAQPALGDAAAQRVVSEISQLESRSTIRDLMAMVSL
jgi:2-methylcitrate dehydratase PrpD